jgi:phage terminase large subunit-like protein
MPQAVHIDSSAWTLEQQREYIKVTQEIIRYLRDDTIYYFTPNPGQQRFFHPEQDHFPRFRVAHAGNRGGKSECGILEDWAFAHGERPWDGTKTPLPVPNRGRIITESYDVIRKNIEPKIKALWPKESILEKKKGQAGHLAIVKFRNGSWIDILSYEQLSEKHESVDLDFVHFDEPPPHAHYIANIRGLVDRGGYWWMTATPIKEPWVIDSVVAKCGKDPNYHLTEWSTYDNVGYGLSEKNIDTFKATLDPSEVQARIYGKPLSLQGAVYPEFKDHYWIPGESIQGEAGGHLIKPFVIPANWPRFFGCDPHDRSPTHGIWLAVNEENEAFVYDEIQLPIMTVKDMADSIKTRETEHRDPYKGQIYRIIDPAAARKNNVLEVGSNIKDQFLENGMYFYSATNELDAGHKKVREYLKFEKTRNGIAPKLFIFDTCGEFRHSLRRYIWDSWSSPKEAQKKDPKQKPREQFKHFPDTLRYLLMANPRYMEPRNYQKRKHVANNFTTGY